MYYPACGLVYTEDSCYLKGMDNGLVKLGCCYFLVVFVLFLCFLGCFVCLFLLGFFCIYP